MYIDPNTGGMVFQILAVVFTALSGLILVFSGRIRMFLTRMRRRSREVINKTDAQNENPDQTPDN